MSGNANEAANQALRVNLRDDFVDGDHGTDPEKKVTELFIAIHNAEVRQVAELLACGAPVNAYDETGYSLLHFAIDSEVSSAAGLNFIDATMTRLLLAFGANPASRNDLNETARDLAIRLNHKLAQQVLEYYSLPRPSDP